MCEFEKPLIWIGSSKRDLMELPVPVRKFFGHALHFAQIGEQHDAAKVLKGFGGAGVLEIVEDDAPQAQDSGEIGEGDGRWRNAKQATLNLKSVAGTFSLTLDFPTPKN